MKDRPTHGFVKKRRDDAAVEQAVVPLMAPQGGVARLGTIAGHLEVEVKPAGIQLTAREAPVLEVDSELRQLCH